MIRTLAIENYRSLSNVVTELGSLTVVTGANGSGKTSFYRALRLLAELARDGAIPTLAREGGMRSALHAGQRSASPVAMRLGFASDDYSYAIDLGLPQATDASGFRLDPQIKTEAVWSGEVLRPATLVADRQGNRVRTRDADGDWHTAEWRLGEHESILSALADPAETPELYALREQAKRWRFYDSFRTDADAAVRRPGLATFTPVLAATGNDLAGALATIDRIGEARALRAAVDTAFDGSVLELTEDEDGTCRIGLRQPGLRRPLGAAELSDGTLRFLLLTAALLSPRPPGLLVLNEPESSLHPSLMPALAALVADAAERSQVVVVTHSADLMRALRPSARTLELVKTGGVTTVAGEGLLDAPRWTWPKR
ncbi:AAA family ATPase [Planctomonas psychrotolerans]|uniref:AAA family ATPase n=1 Tax=Planctomonas psychrotolerans TaxID=2528712 RepID=UPI00123A6A63|nr:AAA family ATPase [Planctomonas psychrotolerans]